MEGGIDGPRSIPDDDDDWTQCCVARAEWEREGGKERGGLSKAGHDLVLLQGTQQSGHGKILR